MHMSDGHHDQVVRPDEVGGLENYNFPISCACAERLRGHRDRVDPRHPLAQVHSSPCCWVLAYGDFTSGEIHKACERSYYRNQFKNCLAIGQLHALMFRDLAAHFQAGQRPVSGRQPRSANAQEGLPRCSRQLGLPRRRSRPAALPLASNVSLHDPRCVVGKRQHQRRGLQYRPR